MLQGMTWAFRGMWALGAAYVAWRLTAGALARVLGMHRRNSGRRAALEARLAVVEVGRFVDHTL